MSKAHTHVPLTVAIIGHTTFIYWKERRIGQIKGLISNILLYTVELVIRATSKKMKQKCDIGGQISNQIDHNKFSIF